MKVKKKEMDGLKAKKENEKTDEGKGWMEGENKDINDQKKGKKL